jgi:hypothetical protein
MGRRAGCAHGGAADVGPRRGFARGQRPVHLFSGLMRCGLCGASYTVVGSGYLACSGRVNKAMCENTRYITTDRLEQLTLAELDRFLSPSAPGRGLRRRIRTRDERGCALHRGSAQKTAAKELAEIETARSGT